MITWHSGNRDTSESLFSIIIPTWNNLSLLKLCINSIEKNSSFKHQIVIHINEGADGTLEWVRKMGYDYTHSEENIGICWALNACRVLAKTDYFFYLNDDMYLLPEWDFHLLKEIESINHKFFFLSSTIIEPKQSTHREILSPFNYGDSVENFDETALLRDYKTIQGYDWFGATWPPNIVHRDIWDLVGGYSVEFFPGLYSDPDFSMKLYEAGVRLFKGVDASRAYHFGSKSTKRIKMNDGSKQFLNKWGITSSAFTKFFLRRGEAYKNHSEDSLDKSFRKALLKGKLKRIIWLMKGTGKSAGKFSWNRLLK